MFISRQTKWFVRHSVAWVLPGLLLASAPELLSSVAVAQDVLPERQAEADRLLQQGNEQSSVSQFREALQSWERALEIYREIGNRQGEGIALGNLGNGYADLGQYEQAINFYEQSLAIAREMRDREGEGLTLGNIGTIYSELGQ